LFDDADAGTPQRFVWLTAVDDDMPEVEPDEPPRLDLGRWTANPQVRSTVSLIDFDTAQNSHLADPADPAHYEVLGVPAIAEDEIKTVQRAIRHGSEKVDPLDGHRLLVQLKVAAALMALEGRRQAITESDWTRARLMMAVSDITRQAVKIELRSKERHQNTNRGRAEGEREIAKNDVIARDRERVKNMAGRILDALRDKDGQTVSVLKKALSGGNKNREVFDRAISYLDGTGAVKREDFTTHNKQESTRLWLV
jgi:hypothetical protein